MSTDTNEPHVLLANALALPSRMRLVDGGTRGEILDSANTTLYGYPRRSGSHMDMLVQCVFPLQGNVSVVNDTPSYAIERILWTTTSALRATTCDHQRLAPRYQSISLLRRDATFSGQREID
ncbi:hypothetical protein M404DRAFT_28992 [Pisolithus tinctorius Marx 270]|uniref:Uncharacterized protein n=1 Tax=Pisolithus tinctorius Marx 270 TaxID=870435 RepID=A0A0C3P0G0_PISTI|nr:hypothetical protein M404DRAFT_28992 [Pisolithus tinctorius Marx 270]